MTADRDEQKAREIVERWCNFESVGLTTAIASALREARREERERCAGHMDSRADEMESGPHAGNISRMFAGIYRGEARAIRALEDK